MYYVLIVRVVTPACDGVRDCDQDHHVATQAPPGDDP